MKKIYGYPEFNDKGLEEIKKQMQWACDAGFYRDLAWEIGTVSNGLPKSIYQDFVGSEKVLGNSKSYWRIYSMTKPLVSVVALALIEKGKLRLFDHVGRFLPNLLKPKILVTTNQGDKLIESNSPMTIFHLLNHTAGLTYGFLPGEVSALYRNAGIHYDGKISLEDEVKRISEIPIVDEPGNNWYYSVSTDVLAYILELVAGMPINEILNKYLFDIIGMNSTSFSVSSEQEHLLIPCYGGKDIFDPEVGLRVSDIFSNNPKLELIRNTISYPHNSNGKFRRGGHGLFSTLSDYGLFAALMLNNAKGVLNRKTMEFMLCDHTSNKMKPLGINDLIYRPTEGLNGYGFGLGFNIKLENNQSFNLGSKGEFGWGGAAETRFFIDPKENFYAVFMAQNLETPGASALFKQMIYSALI